MIICINDAGYGLILAKENASKRVVHLLTSIKLVFMHQSTEMRYFCLWVFFFGIDIGFFGFFSPILRDSLHSAPIPPIHLIRMNKLIVRFSKKKL